MFRVDFASWSFMRIQFGNCIGILSYLTLSLSADAVLCPGLIKNRMKINNSYLLKFGEPGTNYQAISVVEYDFLVG